MKKKENENKKGSLFILGLSILRVELMFDYVMYVAKRTRTKSKKEATNYFFFFGRNCFQFICRASHKGNIRDSFVLAPRPHPPNTPVIVIGGF